MLRVSTYVYLVPVTKIFSGKYCLLSSVLHSSVFFKAPSSTSKASFWGKTFSLPPFTTPTHTQKVKSTSFFSLWGMLNVICMYHSYVLPAKASDMLSAVVWWHLHTPASICHSGLGIYCTESFHNSLDDLHAWLLKPFPVVIFIQYLIRSLHETKSG